MHCGWAITLYKQMQKDKILFLQGMTKEAAAK